MEKVVHHGLMSDPPRHGDWWYDPTLGNGAYCLSIGAPMTGRWVSFTAPTVEEAKAIVQRAFAVSVPPNGAT